MISEKLTMGTEIALSEILARREARADEQRALLKEGGKSLISFTMNLPGPKKRFPLADAGFSEGLTALREALSGVGIIDQRRVEADTGIEVLLLVDAPPAEIKRRTTELEETHPLGRLWDMDVLDTRGVGLSRTTLGLPARTCLLCGQTAKQCARSRNHPKELLAGRAAAILSDYFKDRTAGRFAACAVRALLTEATVTPKPGLVDRANSGSHQDMDYFTFLDSAAALSPWFHTFFCIGWDFDGGPISTLFGRLRYAGRRAEAVMLTATGGVNTHKGLIFSMAILCGAAGLAHREALVPPRLEIVRNICRALGSCALDDFSGPSEETSGLRCFQTLQIAGIRGEAAAGFPSVFRYGLPALETWINAESSLNDAAAAALLSLIAHVEDTNMIRRGGPKEARRRRTEAAAALQGLNPQNLTQTLSALDADYMRHNLTPGGCADLLALTLMLYFLRCGGLLAIIP